jgi:hypothetical protein
VPSYRDWFLIELERELEGVDEGRQAEILAEVDCHLRERIEAHLELGTDPKEAERAAVGGFGEPRRLAREFMMVHVPKMGSDMSFAGIAFAFIVAPFLIGISLSDNEAGSAFLWRLGAVLGAILVWKSWRSPQLQLKPLLLASAAAAAVFCAFLTLGFLNLSAHGGDGYILRGEAASYEREAMRQMPVLFERREQLREVLRQQKSVSERVAVSGDLQGVEERLTRYGVQTQAIGAARTASLGSNFRLHGYQGFGIAFIVGSVALAIHVAAVACRRCWDALRTWSRRGRRRGLS